MLQEKRSNRGWFALQPALKELNWGYYRETPLESPGCMQQQQEMDRDNSGPDAAQFRCSAHSADNGSQFVLSPDYAALRQAGYVMWDAKRKSQIAQFRRNKQFFS